MPSKSLPKSRKTAKRAPSTLKFEFLLDNSPPPPKKLKQLTAFAKPPTFITPTGVVQCDPGEKASQKYSDRVVSEKDASDDRLWSDRYEPTTEADLAVHKRKVNDLRNWFLEAFEGGPSGKLRRYRRILALTGPAGTGKTTTLRVLARELGFEILEWKNPIDDNFSRDDNADYNPGDQWESTDYESLSEKFQAFLLRASRCRNILTAGSSSRVSNAESSNNPRSSDSHAGPSMTTASPRRQVILLEDLPNVLHPRTRDKFHSALETVVHSSDPNPAPIVIIVSDAGLRGEASDEKRSQGVGSWGKEIVDIRTVLPPSLLNSMFVTRIGFNPIAPSLLRKALQNILHTHFSASIPSSSQQQYLPKNILDFIVETSNGDIRSAIMALQFSFVIQPFDKKGKKPLRGGGGTRAIVDAVARREQSLALFHLMGKVLYNKRKGDPPSSSAKGRDLERERELDSRLNDAPVHPKFLAEHNRRASRVDVDTLYSDAPIDSTLFSLYIHQNYTQFCDTIDQCNGVVECLSWVDSSGGELWYQANPHCFHLLTLGTLHSLPSPVTRRSQKFFKPDFFRFREQELEARIGVEDVGRWIMNLGDRTADGDLMPMRWNSVDIVTDIGGVLKARERMGIKPRLPASHRLFSHLEFARGEKNTDTQQLEEEDEGNSMTETNLDTTVFRRKEGWTSASEVASGGWLEADVIEEF